MWTCNYDGQFSSEGSYIYITRFMREMRWDCYTAEHFVVYQEYDSWGMKEFCAECLTSLP